MQHTLGSAARMAGLSKSTLSRGIKDGKLSAIRSDDVILVRTELFPTISNAMVGIATPPA